MTFEVDPAAYDGFMGPYATPLASQFAEFAGVAPPQRVLDVGAGTGILTAVLVGRVGEGAVVAVEPSVPFASALEERFPTVSVVRASAESLPFEDDGFDAAIAQLVVHFMSDPIAGLTEMARVARSGGTVAACVWDHGGGLGPLSLFWQAAREIDPGVDDESGLAGAREGHLAWLFDAAGIREITDTALVVAARYAGFEEWWEPYTLGVGPAGAHVARLTADQRAELREWCRQRLPAGPFEIEAKAWATRGIA